jgi:hypothetical protein
MQKEVTVTDGPRLLQDRRATATGAARLLYECNNGAGLRAKDELRVASGPSFGGGPRTRCGLALPAVAQVA